MQHKHRMRPGPGTEGAGDGASKGSADVTGSEGGLEGRQKGIRVRRVTERLKRIERWQRCRGDKGGGRGDLL